MTQKPRMTSMRLPSDFAFAINQVLTGEKEPKWTTKKEIELTKRYSGELVKNHLKIKSFDVYLALTLRTVNDFLAGELTALDLECDNLTVAYPGGLGLTEDTPSDDSSNEKGDLERYFIEKSKSLLMLRAEKMSVGKYFEAAIAVLSQKPVVLFFNDAAEAKILKTRHPIKTLGTAQESYGFHIVESLSEAIGCLKAELGMDEQFGKDFRSQLNEANTDRSRNSYCPLCESLLKRKSFWVEKMEDEIRGKEIEEYMK